MVTGSALGVWCDGVYPNCKNRPCFVQMQLCKQRPQDTFAGKMSKFSHQDLLGNSIVFPFESLIV